MQKAAILSILAGLAAAIPLGTMHESRGVQACKAASNCETFIHHATNRTLIRFKEGMGPDSDWYHQNVRLRDPHHPMNKHKKRELMERDGTTYNADRDTVTVGFGTYKPSDAVHTMYEHCEDSSCENIKWSLDTTVLSGGTTEPATLEVEAGGQWDSSDTANRGYFIDVLVAQAAPSSEEDNVQTPYGGTIGEYKYNNFYQAMTYLDTNRYVDGNLQGYSSITFTLQTTDPDACDTATGILSAAAGAVSGIGAAFFGSIGTLTCGLGGS